jgi:TonB family protein
MAKRVLLIDYEPRSRERVQALLPTTEFAVVESHDGEEGLNAFSTSHFDLVILSGMLPRLPSALVIREIRRKGGATAPPILLMVSGYKGTNRKADAQRVGAFDLLVRPFTDQDFQAGVQAAIESMDISARTMRISTAELKAESTLTASDIFSDVLEEVGAGAPEAPAPMPAAVSGPTPAPHARQDDVEKRLRDTLSGILGQRSTPREATSPPPSLRSSEPATPPVGPPRFSTDSEIDKMIADTLSGIKLSGRPRAVPSAGPASSPASEPSAGSAPSPGAALKPDAPVSPARPEPAPVSTSGPDRFGEYEILERIAAGGMAELYKARRSGVEGFQKIVAIKKILPHLADNEEFITMFADEAKLAAQLNHPNIVHIFDLGKIEGGGYFIAMEYVDGRDLRALLQAAHEVGSPLPIPLAVYIASKVAAALDYAHRRRDSEAREMTIVHRDVSPQNILISYEGDIKLCDFGIAKAASKASQTQSGALKGKVQYMSPEQAWGKAIDRRSDLFSLSAVLFEMLTEQKLFRGDSDLTVLEKVRAAEVVAPSSINPEISKNLDAIVLKALAREADERYANASDLLRDLEAVLYSYTPAPGSADLAIFLHRLQAEEQAITESKAREAAESVTSAPEKKRKSKGTPVTRRTGSVPKIVMPPAPAPAPETTPPFGAVPRRESSAPGVFGTFSAKRIEAEKKSRTPLYVAIGVACVALAGVAWWTLRKPRAASTAPVLSTTPVPLLPPTPVAASVVPTPAPTPGADAKAIDEEVQRQLAARKKELQKAALEAKARAPREAPAKKGEAASGGEAPVPASEAEPETVPSPVPLVVKAPLISPPAAAEPSPTAAPVRPTVPPPRSEPPEVARGELVGPGPDVVEPSLVALPKISYPPLARDQRVTGKVVVLVLVDEEGNVLETRLQQGIATRTGVNEAILEAVRRARFHPATKSGVPVRMWRTLVVDVKP